MIQLIKIESSLMEKGKHLHLVGGPVRDYLLGFKPKDLDFCTDAVPSEVIEVLKNLNLPIIPLGMEFGTIATLIDGEQVEITTYRNEESYKKGSRKPVVRFGTSLELDLSRRDFTVNAIAMNHAGDEVELVDPFHGQIDLKNKVLRTPLDPSISFGDDPLRMLRAARFVAKFGFTIEPKTFAAIKKMAPQVATVSVERVFQEMDKLLMTDNPQDGLQVMADTGLLKVLFPELQRVVEFLKEQGEYHSKLVWPHILEVLQNSPKRSEVRWAALFHDVAKPETYTVTNGVVHFLMHEHYGAHTWNVVADRLKVGTDFKAHVHILVKEHMNGHFLAADNVTDKPIRQMVVRMGTKQKVADLLDLNKADLTSHNPNRLARRLASHAKLVLRVAEAQADLERVVPKLPKGFGDLLMNAGVPKGPELGRIMKELTEKLVAGEITAVQENLVEIALNLKVPIHNAAQHGSNK